MAHGRKHKGESRGAARQCAALAYAEREGELQVLLVTSRETQRWVLPKGWTEKRVPPHEQAAREAYEEAGLIGRTVPEPIGTYTYEKRLSPKRSIACEVDVYPMRVERQLEDWPERHERRTAWFTLSQAAMAVEEGGLAMLLLGLALPER
jgi:8-oxo-dGTP pyrophosphatase MutT (NUDIX family)